MDGVSGDAVFDAVVVGITLIGGDHADAVEGIEGDQVGGSRGEATDGIFFGSFERDAVLAIGERIGSGEIGADLVAFDEVVDGGDGGVLA